MLNNNVTPSPMDKPPHSTRRGKPVPVDTTGDSSPVDLTVSRIKEGIRSGRYAPGQRLIESDLATEYGLKRGPVRDALRILAGDGVVELVPQKGARVRRLSKSDFVELAPILGGMLRIAVSLAVHKLQAPHFRAQLETTMEGMRQAAQMRDYQQFQYVSGNYAQTLRDAANNSYLTYLDEKLYAELFRRQLTSALTIVDWASYMDHFERLHTALLAGNQAMAFDLIAEHEKRMIQVFSVEDGPAVWD